MILDDKDLEYFGLYLKKGHSHPTPDTRDRTMQVPGMNGSWYFGSDLGNRNFVFPLAFREKDNNSLQKRIRDFVSFLLDSKGKPRMIKLVLDYEKDKYYFVRYSGSISPTRLFGKGSFDLPLTAFDPFAYAELNAYDSPSYYGEVEDGAYYENTKSFQWLYIRQYSGLYNYSDLEIPLILTIEGTMINPTITHMQSGKKLTLPSINSGQTLVIDSSKFTITSNGSNILPQSNGEFLSLVPGDNGFIFEADSANATVTYNWKHKFM